jgi:hypothetical protein
VPEPVLAALDEVAPSRPMRAAMDRLVGPAILPAPPFPHRRAGGLARPLLFMRMHWLKMPPLLLAGHLLRKSVYRWRGNG